jgi:hypothetical protein
MDWQIITQIIIVKYLKLHVKLSKMEQDVKIKYQL